MFVVNTSMMSKIKKMLAEGATYRMIGTEFGRNKSWALRTCKKFGLVSAVKCDSDRARAAGKVACLNRMNERAAYQAAGRAKAALKDPLHLAGCMLYWAEGSKNRNTMTFSNSDPAMARFFVRFLIESVGVEKEKIRATVQCYTGNGVPVCEIEKFWSERLNLSKDQFYKTIVNRTSKSSKNVRKKKLMNGIVRLSVCSTEVVQHIFGAIQYYAKFENPDWVK